MSTRESIGVGSSLAGYRLESLLGHGGMGVVYRAHDAALHRSVAVKLISPRLASDRDFRDRFLVEARLAASLDHPNVVPVHDAGEVDGQLYLVMRYVEGSDLRKLLAEERQLEPGRALAICGQVADALDVAHAKGLVHRDVKPSNVLLDEREHAYLADFGVTRRLADASPGLDTGLSLGTPAYVAPEQIESAGGDTTKVGAPADQYSLACMLYECLAGEPPFRRSSEAATLFAHLDDDPPEYPGLEQVFAKALAKDPAERYPTCTAFTDAARDALGLEQTPRLLRPRWLAAVAAALLLVVAAAVVGGVLAFGGGGESAPKPDLTLRENTVVRIDSETNEVAAVVDVGREPSGLAVGGTTAWVYNLGDGTVSEVDTESAAEVRTQSVAGRPPSRTAAEDVIAADESGAWVVAQSGVGAGLLTRLRPEPLIKAEYPLDYEPHSIALGEDWVWVTARSLGRGDLLRIDPQTGIVDKAIRIDWPHQHLIVAEGAVWTVTTKTAIVGEGGGDTRFTITRWDPDTLEPSQKLTVLHDAGLSLPKFVSVGAGAVWVQQRTQGQLRLSVFDALSLDRIESTAVPHNDYSDAAFSDNAIWLADGIRRPPNVRARIRRLDPQSRELVAEFVLPQSELAADLQSQPTRPQRLAVADNGLWFTLSTADQ